ncbi:hypothetical protein ABH926_002175 [Catenulispora sp. GP43]|uniref:tectonin domain-containing protein n=1 Tax=Catenulispora sp. GP43 TaxID=3156263 RepID=UPI00351284F5
MRYAIQRWGLTGNDGGDGKDQADNLTAALNKIHPGRFVLRGNSLSDHTAPQPGDVIAYYDSGAGHTGVVLASHVDANGNGTIDMVHQNWNEVPSTPGEWDGISVSNGMVENVLGGSGDVHWMHDTSSDVAPSVSAPGGLANGGTYHGTVTVTGSASPNASAYYLHLRPAAGGADIVPHPAIAGGTSFSYQFDTTGASDSPALTIPDGGYQAFIGAVVNGAEVDGPAVSITIANAPAMPTFHAPAGLAYGMITLTASAISSNTTAVHYKVDGAEVGQATSATAFNYTLDTTSLTNGTHTITAYASNAGGRSADTPGVTITVANDRIYALAPDKSAISVYNGTGTGPGAWTAIGGAATQILAGDAGLFAVNPNDGSINKYNGSGSGPAAWTSIGGAAAQFAVGGGHLYGLASDKSAVSVYNGTGTGPGAWTVIGGAATQIYAGDAGLFAVNPNDGSISRYNGSGSGPAAWTVVGGAGAQFAVGGGHLYGLAPDKSSVSEWDGTGTNWHVVGGAATAIYAGGYGLFATNPNDGSISLYNGTGSGPAAWTAIGGPAAAFAVGNSHIAGLAGDLSAVSTYNGSGTGPGAWTAIGNAASQIAIGS